MRDKILLTGATGALGSMLLPRLLAAGHRVVCLVRASDQRAAKNRVKLVADYHPNLKVLRGDITEDRCGLSDIDRLSLLGYVTTIMHCAASINFMDKKAAHASNVDGVSHIIELADAIDAKHIMHVSTAYVAGDAPYLSEQSLSIGQNFRNSYEQTKYLGEKIVREWVTARDDRRLTIFRPSILIGCADGMTPTYGGYYAFTGAVEKAARLVRDRAHKGLPSDISIKADGTVHLPLVITMADEHVNYIPIDWVADIMVTSIGLSPQHKSQTYHLVHPDPIRMRDATRWSLDYLKIDGLKVVSTRAEKEATISRQSRYLRMLQRMLDAVHDAYLPYCTTAPCFQMEAAREILGDSFKNPPVIDQGYLHRTLNYALFHDWGARS